MKSVIVGTAGHIDHGKSALVRALTGIDPDRLEEEKRRGITIDLGFANLDLQSPSGESIRIGLVDVPEMCIRDSVEAELLFRRSSRTPTSGRPAD